MKTGPRGVHARCRPREALACCQMSSPESVRAAAAPEKVEFHNDSTGNKRNCEMRWSSNRALSQLSTLSTLRVETPMMESSPTTATIARSPDPGGRAATPGSGCPVQAWGSPAQSADSSQRRHPTVGGQGAGLVRLEKESPAVERGGKSERGSREGFSPSRLLSIAMSGTRPLIGLSVTS